MSFYSVSSFSPYPKENDSGDECVLPWILYCYFIKLHVVIHSIVLGLKILCE